MEKFNNEPILKEVSEEKIEEVSDAEFLKEIGFDIEARSSALAQVGEMFGDRVFTYKQYSGTVADMAGCPVFYDKLQEEGPEAAAAWLLENDESKEERQESESEDDEEEIEDFLKKAEDTEKPAAKNVPEKQESKAVQPEEAAIDDKPDRSSKAESKQESVERIEVDSSGDSLIVNNEGGSIEPEKNDSHEAVGMTEVASIQIEEKVQEVAPEDKDKPEAIIEIEQSLQVEPSAIESTVDVNEEITQQIVPIENETRETEEPEPIERIATFVIPDFVKSKDEDRTEPEQITIAEPVIEGDIEQENPISKEVELADETTELPSMEEMLPVEEQAENIEEEVLYTEVYTGGDESDFEPIVLEIATALIGKSPDVESQIDIVQIQQQATAVIKKIEVFETLKTAEECREAIEELKGELELLLMQLGYHDAAGIAERLIKQYDMSTLKQYIEVLLRALQQQSQKAKKHALPRYNKLLPYHLYGTHAVRRVVSYA